uniref:Uncharacterized protein n=1 Tax=Pithovirus LCPAC404 TaxID=2506597 RepID=A0A481ZC29_9VIRU|nr:MAG: hypothetical protein LCPAC404_01320 [Pithovirus LCPAC404]
MSDILLTLLTLQNQIKLHHWQTTSFSRHKATDDLFEKIIPLIDRFVETFQGSHNNTIMLYKLIELKNMSEDEIVVFLTDMGKTMRQWNLEETELDNIIQEMLEVVNVTLFLFSLN